jgi:branched-chain amino acid transport system ATP-binding protein
MTSPAVLETTGLTVRFGGLLAVSSVDLDCRRGELTGLIGPNGAGKTTFIDAITGFLPRNASGQVVLDGSDVSGWAPHRLAQAGLCRTWQSLELFDDITVRANLDVASRPLTFVNGLADYFTGSQGDERVDEVLNTLNLSGVADRRPNELSQGQRKLVGVGRALVADARLLLLDEPAAGLDRRETVWLGTQLRRIVDAGTPVLLVDHDMGLVLSVCDRIHVLEFGQLIATGTPEEIRTSDEVIAAYLGGSGGGS